ncbi:MAG TPA: hypothetical protein VJI32_03335 [Candidatus Nanoarchaeia archaeon]|nr:hypothetical protein [Candidatus Nanoarchaeia archaeon]
MAKKGIAKVPFVLDLLGFVLLLVGGGMIRYAKDEIISIFGGMVMAVGVGLLSLSRYILK